MREDWGGDTNDIEDREDWSVAGNLLPPVLGIAALVYIIWALGPGDTESPGTLSYCTAIANDPARLACYDQLAAPHPPAKGAVAPVPERSP